MEQNQTAAAAPTDKPKRYMLVISAEKSVQLNPWKRITKGTTVKVNVDGVDLEAIVDTAGKYTYLNVQGVDYYVTAKLEDGMNLSTVVRTPAAPKAKAKAKPAAAATEGGEAATEPVAVESAEPVAVEEPAAAPKQRKPRGEAAAAA